MFTITENPFKPGKSPWWWLLMAFNEFGNQNCWLFCEGWMRKLVATFGAFFFISKLHFYTFLPKIVLLGFGKPNKANAKF